MNGRASIGFLQVTPLSKSVAGGANVTLTAAEAASGYLKLTGALSANIQVILPSADFLAAGSTWTIENACTGATGGVPYYVTFIGPTGSGVIVTQGQIVDVISDGTNLNLRQKFANLASQDPIGAQPFLVRIDVPAGTTGNVDTTPVPYKIRIVDVFLVKQTAAGGGAGTIQVLNSASAITDAMSINVADQTVVRAATMNDANWEIAAGGTLRVTRTRTASSDESCTVYCWAARVA